MYPNIQTTNKAKKIKRRSYDNRIKNILIISKSNKKIITNNNTYT